MSVNRTKDAEFYPKHTQPSLRTPPPSQLEGFEDLFWLFSVGHHNRGIVRLDLDEATLLFKLTKAARGASLEIGSRHGGTTVIMLAASQGRSLVSIDIDPNHYPVCQKFLAQAVEAGRLSILKQNSRKALPDHNFNLIFIDGDHSFEGVCADIRAHWPSLQAVGSVPPICVFHDVSPSGLGFADPTSYLDEVRGLPTVTAAVRRLLALQCGVIHAVAGSLVAIRKTQEIPPTFPDSLNGVCEE